jgi:hypothetical protein
LTSDRFAPFFHAPVLRIMAGLGLAIVILFAVATLARRRGTATSWAPTLLRVLAVLGLVLPVWAIIGWYHDLSRARELTRGMPISTQVIAERFVINAAALTSVGFLLLVTGIYLARRVGRSRADQP